MQKEYWVLGVIMSKTFRYTRQCGPSYYSEETDEDFCDEESFDYEVDSDQVSDACAELTYDDFFSTKLKQIPEVKDNKELQKQLRKVIQQGISQFISELDVSDQTEEYFEESLKDYFEEDAMEAWND